MRRARLPIPRHVPPAAVTQLPGSPLRPGLAELVSPGDPRTLYRDRVMVDQGSYGTLVYRAEDPRSGGRLALKAVPLTRSEKEQTALENEITMLRACYHPNIIGSHGCWQTGRSTRATLWIGMEWMDGGKLTDLLVDGQHFLPAQVGFLLHEALKGIEYVHRMGSVHRDVKSDNLLVDSGGHVKLADFGLATLPSEDECVHHAVVGTPCWMAPEVARGHGYGPRADVWSLGIVGLELCNGETPHASLPGLDAMFAIVNSPAPRVAQGSRGTRWPAALAEFVDAMLVKSQHHRPPSAEMLRHSFLRAGGATIADPALFLRSALRWAHAMRAGEAAC